MNQEPNRCTYIYLQYYKIVQITLLTTLYVKFVTMSCLVQYSDSEDELSDKEDPDCIGMKRKNPTNFQVCTENNKKLRSSECLPLPDSIKTLFSSGKKHEDNNEVHEGRIRSFEHLEGNWATHIGVSYDPDERTMELIDELLKCLRPLEFIPMKDLHLSLSRTVAIRHHWIQPLTDRLQRRFKLLPKTCCEISSVKLYTNDEKTRSFFVTDCLCTWRYSTAVHNSC